MRTLINGKEVKQLNLHDISAEVIQAMRNIQEYDTINGKYKGLTQPQKWERAAKYYLKNKHKIIL